LNKQAYHLPHETTTGLPSPHLLQFTTFKVSRFRLVTNCTLYVIAQWIEALKKQNPTPLFEPSPTIAPTANNTMAEPIFTLCRKLAPEIGLKIWKEALPDQRYIEVQTVQRCDGTSSWDEKFRWKLFSKDRAPAVLFVCHESRAAFIGNYFVLRTTEKGHPAAYFNPSIDVLVFRYSDHQTPDVFELEAFVNHLSHVVSFIRYCLNS
jgi:hypothetical protein